MGFIYHLSWCCMISSTRHCIIKDETLYMKEAKNDWSGVLEEIIFEELLGRNLWYIRPSILFMAVEKVCCRCG